MKLVGKVLVLAGCVVAGASGLAAGIAAVVRRTARASATPERGAGAMFVGAVDEVELSRVAGAEAYDLEGIPSEHGETNELRSKMPFG